MKSLFPCVLVACLIGCHQAEAPRTTAAATLGADDPSGFVTRTTTEDDVTLTVCWPRDTVPGTPIPVRVEIANHSTRPLTITYSEPVRFVSPGLWIVPPTGKLPFTKEGERVLGSRDETHNISASIEPQQTWTCEFDLTRYYQVPSFPMPVDLLLGVRVRPERIDPKTGKLTEIWFELRGLKCHLPQRI